MISETVLQGKTTEPGKDRFDSQHLAYTLEAGSGTLNNGAWVIVMGKQWLHWRSGLLCLRC